MQSERSEAIRPGTRILHACVAIRHTSQVLTDRRHTRRMEGGLPGCCSAVTRPGHPPRMNPEPAETHGGAAADSTTIHVRSEWWKRQGRAGMGLAWGFVRSKGLVCGLLFTAAGPTGGTDPLNPARGSRSGRQTMPHCLPCLLVCLSSPCLLASATVDTDAHGPRSSIIILVRTDKIVNLTVDRVRASGFIVSCRLRWPKVRVQVHHVPLLSSA